MTRDEILKLDRRELAEAVALKVMRLPKLALENAPCPYCADVMRFCGQRSRCTTCGEWRHSPYKEYDDDIEAAMEVEDEIQQRGLIEPYVNALEKLVGLGRWNLVHAPPKTRCRAALLAVEGAGASQ